VSRQNPLASYTVPDRKLRKDYDQSQWYLFSKVAPQVFERVFRRWPLPVRIVLSPVTSPTVKAEDIAQSVLHEHPESCNIVIRHWFPHPDRPERFDPDRESPYTPFTLMHRIYDETATLPQLFYRKSASPKQGFLGSSSAAFFDSPELRKLLVLYQSDYLSSQEREYGERIKSDLLDTYRSLWMRFRRGAYKDPPIVWIQGLAVDTKVGRNSVMDLDQADADVFAKWMLYRKWAYQSEPPYRLTPGQKRFIEAAFKREGGDSYLFFQAVAKVLQSKDFIEYRRAHNRYIRKYMSTLAKVLQNYPFTLVI